MIKMTNNHHVFCSTYGDEHKKGCNGCACYSIAKNTKTPYWKASWENEKSSIFLGTERNHESKLVYDYWIVNNEKDPSWTCKHGDEDHEYSSGLIKFMNEGDFMPHILKLSSSDYIFGMTRAKYLSLLYLATAQKPLLDKSY